MIFPSIAECQENMIFTLSVFTKMLFFMQCITIKKEISAKTCRKLKLKKITNNLNGYNFVFA